MEMSLNEFGVLSPSFLFPRRWWVLAQQGVLWVLLIHDQIDQAKKKEQYDPAEIDVDADYLLGEDVTLARLFPSMRYLMKCLSNVQ